MDALETLVTEFARLPGVGRKTAQRFAYHLLRQPRDRMVALAAAVAGAAERIRPCEVCGAPTESPRCTVCSDQRRDAGVICVVEEPSGMAVLERAGTYRGSYLVLGGRLAPLEGIGPDALRFGLLRERLDGGGVREVILATSSSLEGEATATWLRNMLAAYPGVQVSRLARGLPVGGELEYIDGVTLSHALTARETL